MNGEAKQWFMNIGDDRNAFAETIEEIMRKAKYAPVEIMINDTVNHPNHYTKGGIECISAIKASMTSDGFCDYCKGNIIKYIWRWRDKGGVQDLEKAKVYLKRLIEEAEK